MGPNEHPNSEFLSSYCRRAPFDRGYAPFRLSILATVLYPSSPIIPFPRLVSSKPCSKMDPKEKFEALQLEIWRRKRQKEERIIELNITDDESTNYEDLL
ncbi:hypothetical protein V6N12_038792 [Hibiscus sabdariffa]|uniref:Uncharacterized protein n=1 Tax=Hibiscus sabdariffa TaxID=183260 RepID=A0ABR2CB95_9ROSI